MSQLSPQFERPPVIETALGVHFETLSRVSNAHLGWFWKSCLDGEWEQATDAMYLPPQSETFGTPLELLSLGMQVVQIQQAAAASRVQLLTGSGDRMIQIQNSRFHYNWRKRDGVYPSYRTMLSEFEGYFDRFRRFVAENKLGEVCPVQWELTYMDYVPPGELWRNQAEWGRILPGLLGSGLHADGFTPEMVQGNWTFEIAPQRGRLYFSLALGKPAEGGELGLMLQTTARGPIPNAPEAGLGAGLEIGHDAVLQGFLAVVSAEAKSAWGWRGK